MLITPETLPGELIAQPGDVQVLRLLSIDGLPHIIRAEFGPPYKEGEAFTYNLDGTPAYPNERFPAPTLFARSRVDWSKPLANGAEFVAQAKGIAFVFAPHPILVDAVTGIGAGIRVYNVT